MTTKPRITITTTPSGFIEIWMNPAGRELLVSHIMALNESNEHLHFGEGEDVELSPRAYRPEDKVHAWGKLFLRLDEWDRQYFAHLFPPHDDGDKVYSRRKSGAVASSFSAAIASASPIGVWF